MSVILDHAIMNITPIAFINGWKDMIHVHAVGEMYSRDLGQLLYQTIKSLLIV